MNHISNGGFAGNLSGWDAGGGAVFAASQGNDVLGAAYLANAGDSISQQFGLPISREYMLAVFAKAAAAGSISVTITNSDGDAVYTSSSAAVGTSWEAALDGRIGLPQGSFSLEIAYVDQPVYIDDVSLAWVIATRAELADKVAKLLGDLASSDAAYSTSPQSPDLTEGDYTDAIDFGLRQVGAVDMAGQPDVRALDDDTLDAAVDEIQRYMLNKLHRYYARHATDFSLEGRTEHYQQRVGAIEKLLGIAVGGRASASGRSVRMGQLKHRSTLG